VEFALAISVFMSVLLVGFQFGIIAMQQYSLQHATRHTARWLAVNPDVDETASPNPVLAHARANGLSLNPNLITSAVPDPVCNWGGSPAHCQNRISSGAVKVTVTYNISPQIILPPALLQWANVPTTLQAYAVSIMIE
jgi:Flp pilus assembly protein TadG